MLSIDNSIYFYNYLFLNPLIPGGEHSTDIDAQVAKLLENSSNPLLNIDGLSDDRVWIDLVNIRFSCGTGESIKFHFDDVIKRVSFDEAFLSITV